MKSKKESETGTQPKGRYIKKNGSELKKITFYLSPDMIKKLNIEKIDNNDSSLSITLQRILVKHYSEKE